MARKPQNPFPEIDFSAAGPPPGLKAQPATPAPAKRRRGRPAKTAPSYNLDNIYIDSRDKFIEGYISLEDKLTEKELKFLEYYIAEDMTIEKAMKLAGYENLPKSTMYDLAGKIRNKYEQQTADGRKYFQLIGFGPLEVAKKIKSLATTARSEMVQLNATGLAAKGTRLIHEPEQTHQGVKIIINCPPPDPNAPPPPGPPSFTLEPERPRIPPQSRPLQITK
jgi:hypothetical protein